MQTHILTLWKFLPYPAQWFMAKADISKDFLFFRASIQSGWERKIEEHVCSGQKGGNLPTRD